MLPGFLMEIVNSQFQCKIPIFFFPVSESMHNVFQRAHREKWGIFVFFIFFYFFWLNLTPLQLVHVLELPS
jgi:F0F1-type ATP synthase membrane subunit a